MRLDRRSLQLIWVQLILVSMLASGSGAWAQQSPAGAVLSASELRGKKVFMQRCSICHLPPLYRPPTVKPYGPLLDGYLRNAQAEQSARKAIREGTPRMPGFQYGLQASEIDDVIAYLKTLKPAASEGNVQGGSNANTGRVGD